MRGRRHNHRHGLVAGSLATLLFLGLFGLLSALSCGAKAPPPTPLATTVPVHPAPLLAASDVAGYWQWSLASEQSGIRRIEREVWELKVTRRRVTGTYERVVSFLSLDGVPFTCSQSLSYERRAIYMLDGELGTEGLVLRESDYEVSPSPCEDGHRSLGSYRGQVKDGRLVLTWPTGDQTLRRVDEAFVRARLATSAPGRAGELAGTWHWQSTSRHGSEARVEREIWRFAGGTSVTATFARTVTLIREDGLPFACGRSQYSYEDVYTVTGTSARGRLQLYEVAVKAGDDPCLPYTHKERHLDAASAELLGDHLVLTWRGGRRQVLSRLDRDRASAMVP